MHVRFRLNTQPCVQYRVLSGPVMEFDEVEDRYCECYELEVLGFVWTGRLAPANHLHNRSAIDLAIQLSQ